MDLADALSSLHIVKPFLLRVECGRRFGTGLVIGFRGTGERTEVGVVTVTDILGPSDKRRGAIRLVSAVDRSTGRLSRGAYEEQAIKGRDLTLLVFGAGIMPVLQPVSPLPQTEYLLAAGHRVEVCGFSSADNTRIGTVSGIIGAVLDEEGDYLVDCGPSKMYCGGPVYYREGEMLRIVGVVTNRPADSRTSEKTPRVIVTGSVRRAVETFIGAVDPVS